jgi:FHS family L-fucose permease-like MFS transporter
MQHQWKSLLLVAYVFLFIGAIVSMNDVLLPSVKEVFHLNFVQATFIQQSFYLVYLVFPIPMAYYISKYGYKNALVSALVICSTGALLFYPAFHSSSYMLALSGVFVISVGVTLVNVAANPLAALLGDPSGSHVRVNIVQLFSRIGATLTPILATKIIYGEGATVSFHLPYLVIGTATLLLAAGIFLSKLPAFKPAIEKGFSLSNIVKESRRYPQLYWGALVMFFYIGADASTAGFFISYLRDPAIAGYSPEKAANFLSLYYLAATIFSFIGIYLLQFISPGRLIAILGIGMVTLYLTAIFTISSLNPYIMVGLGAFISIMFASIFSLSIEGVGDFTEKGSALVNIAIVGGAVFPPLQGMVADSYGVQVSYLIPCICFLLVIIYGIFCDRHTDKPAPGQHSGV